MESRIAAFKLLRLLLLPAALPTVALTGEGYGVRRGVAAALMAHHQAGEMEAFPVQVMETASELAVLVVAETATAA
jgi:hypothetical protein